MIKHKIKRITCYGIGIIAMVILSNGIAKGQESKVKLLDFAVMPFFDRVDMTGKTSPSDSMKYRISFKINNALSAKKLHINLGGVEGLSDVRKMDVDIIIQGGKPYLRLAGLLNEIQGIEVGFIIKLSKQEEAKFKHASLFVTDNLGLNTGKLVF